MPDAYGNIENLVLSYPDVTDYYNDQHYIGAVVGRYANRIAGGKLNVGDAMFQLGLNENVVHHLHGGKNGFHKKLWHIQRTLITKNCSFLELTLFSPHMEEGYPGNVRVTVTYTLNDANELTIRYQAITDLDTVINLTNHSYFNLSGGKRDISGHSLRIAAKIILQLMKLIFH